MTVFTSDSPERGWGPFLEWLREHDINPDWCSMVETGDDRQYTAYLFELDAEGRPVVDGDELVIQTRDFIARRPAPRRVH